MRGKQLPANPADRSKRLHGLALGLLLSNSRLAEHTCSFLQMSAHFGEHLVALGGGQMQAPSQLADIGIDRVLIVWHNLAFPFT